METLKIVKIGGHIINDTAALASFLATFNALPGAKILVHGGGRAATDLARSMGVEVIMVNGRRITDTATLDIATMVYAGKINKTVVAQLQALGCNAMGFTGADGNTILAQKRPVKELDYGWVGDIIKVETDILEVLLSRKRTPIFCAITHDGNGQLLNTNADTLAASLATAFSNTYHTELYYIFEKKGVLRSIDDEESVIEHINKDTYKQLKTDGVIADGMLPKLENCRDAVQNGVAKVCIGLPEMLVNPLVKHTTITN